MAALLSCLLVAATVAGFFARQAELARATSERSSGRPHWKSILEAMSGDTPPLSRPSATPRTGLTGPVEHAAGLIETSRGKPREARVYLEQAERQLPGSVAVKVLLAQTHAFEGEFWKADEIIAALDKLQAQTTEDYVFLGLAQGVMDPDRGLKALDAAFACAARLGPAYPRPGP